MVLPRQQFLHIVIRSRKFSLLPLTNGNVVWEGGGEIGALVCVCVKVIEAVGMGSAW